jgi:tRNA (guanine9-N1)-methyltransferase
MANVDDIEERPHKLRKLSHSEDVPVNGSENGGFFNKVEESRTISSVDYKPVPIKVSSHEDRTTTDENAEHCEIRERDEISGQKQEEGGKPLSKNQLKKLRRQEAWEAGRGDRALKRREKRKQKQEAKRAKRTEAEESGIILPQKFKTKATASGNLIPMTFIIDCSFDSLMVENEIISLSQQICRSYSAVRSARYRPQLLISGYSGRLRDRFERVMRGQYENWKGAKMIEDDLVEAGRVADSQMKTAQGRPHTSLPDHISAIEEASSTTQPGPSLVYLCAESPNVLKTLSPNTSYIIGGLVDRNRHKSHCYSVANAANLPTARLPIDDYVKLSTRKVLVTNHVVEIMLKYLETGDWAESFLSVIPQRTGVDRKESLGHESENSSSNSERAKAERT